MIIKWNLCCIHTFIIWFILRVCLSIFNWSRQIFCDDPGYQRDVISHSSTCFISLTHNSYIKNTHPDYLFHGHSSMHWSFCLAINWTHVWLLRCIYQWFSHLLLYLVIIVAIIICWSSRCSIYKTICCTNHTRSSLTHADKCMHLPCLYYSKIIFRWALSIKPLYVPDVYVWSTTFTPP